MKVSKNIKGIITFPTVKHKMKLLNIQLGY